MSQQTTIRKLAELVNTPVEKLLEQLAGAGMKFSGPDQVVTSSEKVKLLGFLRRSHGKPEQAPEETDQSAKKITLNRRKQQEVTVNSGRSKTTVNVEVRQKRTYVKDGARAMTPDEERADILRKLEESRARNLAEQQALAEKDRLRDEAIVRAREEEVAAKERAEAEKKAAEEAAAAAKAAEALAASKPKRAPIDETAPRPPRPGRRPGCAAWCTAAAAQRRPQQPQRAAQRAWPGRPFRRPDAPVGRRPCASWQQQQQQHPGSSGRPQPGRWPSRHVARWQQCRPARLRASDRTGGA
jgi:translation initiation factor IF-2